MAAPLEPLSSLTAVVGQRVTVEDKGAGTLIGWKFAGQSQGDASGAPRTADDYFRINLDR